jgi:hypothetical protein
MLCFIIIKSLNYHQFFLTWTSSVFNYILKANLTKKKKHLYFSVIKGLARQKSSSWKLGSRAIKLEVGTVFHNYYFFLEKQV